MAKQIASDKKKYPPLILELTDRRPSSFIMKGTENTENPDRLDCASEYLLRNNSVALIGGERKKIRYIFGCPLFLVEEQDKQNYKPNPKQDIIAFTFGRLTVERDGIYIGLYDYLLHHEGNRDLGANRPSGAEDTFYQINTSAESENKLVDLEDIAAVMNIITELRTKVPGGRGKAAEYIYDSEKIAHISKLLGIMPLPSDAERLQVILSTATLRPAYFLNLLNEASGGLRVEIVTARELGVLSMDGPQATWIKDNMGFYKFKATKNFEKRIDELVAYFSSEEARDNLAILRAQVTEIQEQEMAHA